MKTNRVAMITIIALGLAAALPARAQSGSTLIWTNGSDVWQSTTAWSVAPSFPGAGDNAFFTNAATYTVTLTNNVTIQSNYFSNASNTIATVTLNLGTFSFTSAFSNANNSGFVAGDGAGSTTTVYIISSTQAQGGLVTSGQVTIGRSGLGILYVTNGYFEAGPDPGTKLGSNPGGQGVVVISGPNTYWNNTRQLSIGSSNTFGNLMVVSNSASLTVGSTFRLGSAVTGGSSNNTLILDSGARANFASGNAVVGKSGGTAGAYNNTMIVQGGAICDFGNHTFFIGSASDFGDTGPATGNVLTVKSASFVTNVVRLSIAATNTLDLQGGFVGVSLVTTNRGTIQGFGTLSSRVINLGLISPNGGTLLLNSASNIVQNGSITVPTDSILQVVGSGGVQNDGQILVAGGTLLASNIVLGSSAGAQGSLTVASGTNVLSDYLAVGSSADATGSVWVTGGQLIKTNFTGGVTAIGYFGVGQMTVSNGTWMGQGGDVDVAYGSGSVGTLTVAGGTSTLASGGYGMNIGFGSGGTGTVWVTGGQLIVTNNGAITQIGSSGVGQMTVSNGTVLAGNVYVGPNPGSQGTLTVAGGTIVCQSPVFSLGELPLATGTVWMTGGEVDVTNALFGAETVVGDSGFGALTLSNGTVRTCNLMVGSLGGRGIVTVNGGAMIVTNCSGATSTDVRNGSITLSGGVLATDSLVLTNVNGSLTLNGGLLICHSSIVSNGQRFIIGSNSTFQAGGGIQSFAAGLLIQTNSAGSGTLSGSGTITGNVVNQGNVLATGGTTLNLTGTVTNNATITATGGTVLKFYGPVVNTGLIDGSGGDVQFLSSVSGGGVILTPTNTWTDGTDKWETSTNWSHGTAPSSTDAANLITNAGNNTVTIDATTAGSFPGAMTIRNLTLAGAGSSTNTLALTNAGFATPLHVLYELNLSNNSAVVINNSALQVDGDVSMGLFGSGNQLIITNGGQLVSTTAGIGIGLPGLDSVVITGSNSLWSNYGTIQVGYGGAGDSLTIADGGALIASNANHTARVVVNGATLFLGTGTFKPDNLVVTNGGVVQYAVTYQVDNGTVTVAGGSVQAGSNLVVASTANSTGTFLVVGGTLVATNGLVGVGTDGTVTNNGGVGLMVVSNGTLQAIHIVLGSGGGQGDLLLGEGGSISCPPGANCLIEIDSLGFGEIGDLVWTNGTLECGVTRAGDYSVSNGTASFQDLYIGYSDRGTMTMAGGAASISSHLIVGHVGPQTPSAVVSTGMVWITGGQITMNNNYTLIGNSGVGQMTMSNGVVTAADVIVANSSNPGTLTLVGGTLTVNSLVLTNPSSRFNFSGGWLNVNAISNANGQAVTVGNGVAPAAVKLLGGTSSLNNGLTVAANALFTGSGTVPGSVANFGIIAPGGSGDLTFTGPVTNNGLIFTNSTIHFPGGLSGPGRILDAAGDADGDGMNNLWEIQAGTNPTNATSRFCITAVTKVGNDVQVSWSTVGGKSYTVQADMGSGGNYSSASFTDISPTISVPGTGESTTNFLEAGGATFIPSRFYRVRLVP